MKHLRRILAAAALCCALAVSASAGIMGTGYSGDDDLCGQMPTPCTPQADGIIHTGVNVNGQIGTPGLDGDMETPLAGDGWIGTGFAVLGGLLGLY